MSKMIMKHIDEWFTAYQLRYGNETASLTSNSMVKYVDTWECNVFGNLHDQYMDTEEARQHQYALSSFKKQTMKFISVKFAMKYSNMKDATINTSAWLLDIALKDNYEFKQHAYIGTFVELVTKMLMIATIR